MWMDKMTNGSTIAGLSRLVQFTEERHKVLANNVANIDTPDYKMRDLSIGDFQRDLQTAMEQSGTGNSDPAATNPIEIEDKVDFSQYLLFHDGNNRSVEKQMAAVTENAVLHNMAVELLRGKFNGLSKAVELKP